MALSIPLRLASAAVAVLLCAAVAAGAPGASLPTVLTAADGVRVYAEYRAAEGPEKALLLLFHQAGSNAAEYDPIAPRLARAGYATLAVDLRSGGTKWGANNRTVAALGRATAFPAAYADMEAALEWARARAGATRIGAWGSSYTAALVFRLAAEHREVRAVVAFSPGEHLGAGEPVRGWAARVSVPVFVADIPGTERVDATRIFDAAASAHKVHYAPADGAHGSSMLREDRNEEGAASAWKAVLEFLDGTLG